MVLSTAVGAIYGFIFGVLDVEDEVNYQLTLALKREESYCYPIGAVRFAVLQLCLDCL